MDFAAQVLMLFPAFMIGSAFGILIILGLAGTSGLKTFRPVAFSIAGSVMGIVVFVASADWWPPVIGPFICCPALAAVAALIGRAKS
jgi:hypothetical protein